MKISNRFWAILLTCSLVLLGQPGAVQADSTSRAKSLFKNPPREYSTGPLWVWNDMLTEHQIRDTLNDLARQSIRQVWVHPRPGLMTPYLSDDWFRLWHVALEEAERLDMNVWIYDENSYPSGFAGGFVPEAMPESRGCGLVLREEKAAPQWSSNFVAVFQLSGDRLEDVSPRLKAGESLPEASYMVAERKFANNSPWHGNRSYVNLLSPGVTEKFLEITMETYRKHLGRHFGKRIPGVFTDEPNIKPVNALPWSEVLADVFEKRWGYSLLPHLPSLSKPIGDWQRIRHNYYQVLNEQFVERWGKPYFSYCETNRLAFTGHYWDHEWPDCTGVPDNMAMYAWHQWPAIDTLMNQYSEHTHAQFGNVRMCRELLSVANQMGRKRTLCEIYGAAGWDLRFEDMKRIGDWLEVLGINTLNQHLSYVTIRGARKRDHPQSFSYHEPWWEAYHLSADYFARLSAALAQGEQVNRILVLQPTTTAWMYQGDEAKLTPLGNSFFSLLMALEAAQIEYDIGSEDLIARFGSVARAPAEAPSPPASAQPSVCAKFTIGQRSYSAVVIPPNTENLNRRTMELLEDFLAPAVAGTAGSSAYVPGQVICASDTLSLVDGKISDRVARLQKSAYWARIAAADIAETLAAPPYSANPGIHRQPGDKGILFHHRRLLTDGELWFLVNSSSQASSAGRIESRLAGAEKWDPYTGGIEPYPFVRNGSGFSADFELPPSGSLLLFLSRKTIKPAPKLSETTTVVEPSGAPEIGRLEPNVLTVDYVDVTAGGETKTNIYFYPANQFTWKQNGMERNPWDSAVQFKDELIAKRFPANSGFSAAYKFTIKGEVPSDLAIVIERPDLYEITCNGQGLSCRAGDWWLDKAFGRIPIGSVARSGENVVQLEARPFTMFHELEPIYVLGSFAAQPVARGFVIGPEQPIRLGTMGDRVTHVSDPGGTMWCTVGVGFKKEPQGGFAADRAPFLIFDLGRRVELSALRIWNYGENQTKDMTGRGVKSMRVSGSTGVDTNAFDIALGTLELGRATGVDSTSELLPLKSPALRFLRFEVLSNHNGVSFPVEGEPNDNGFVGLAEVQFLTGEEVLDGVKIVQSSSDLVSHRRFAAHLVDGSGLTRLNSGWNRQGLPFYGGSISYTECFDIRRPSGRYSVVLTNWHGSIAAVKVNGRPAGYIDAPPWERDISRWIKRGTNRVEVTVVGTLKNTLGPHHGGAAPGAAWPWAFQKAPETGPPPGAHYSTVAYGLFGPFVLKKATVP